MMKVKTNCLYLILENLDMSGDYIRDKSIFDVLIVEYWLRRHQKIRNIVRIV